MRADVAVVDVLDVELPRGACPRRRPEVQARRDHGARQVRACTAMCELYFVFIVDSAESELGMLDLIQVPLSSANGKVNRLYLFVLT